MDFSLDEEQRRLRETARRFARAEMASVAEEIEAVDEPLSGKWRRRYAEMGFLGVNVAADLGGLGLGNLEALIVLEEFARVSSAVAFPIFESCVGPVRAIEHFAGPELKRRGIPSADVVFEDARVPAANLIVPAGGFRKLMEAFDLERCGNAVMALGQASGALAEVLAYVQERRQFGKPIVEFQAVQLKLADMAMRVEAARLLILRAASGGDGGGDVGGNGGEDGGGLPSILDSSLAKCFANEIAREVTGDAVQLMGGYGYSKEYAMERRLRDAWGWGHRRRHHRHPEGQHRRRPGRAALRPAPLGASSGEVASNARPSSKRPCSMNPIMALRAIFPRRRLAAPRLQDAAQFLDRVGREGQWAGAALGIGGRRQQRPAFVEPPLLDETHHGAPRHFLGLDAAKRGRVLRLDQGRRAGDHLVQNRRVQGVVLGVLLGLPAERAGLDLEGRAPAHVVETGFDPRGAGLEGAAQIERIVDEALARLVAGRALGGRQEVGVVGLEHPFGESLGAGQGRAANSSTSSGSKMANWLY